MNNFDLTKYLAEGKLYEKEDIKETLDDEAFDMAERIVDALGAQNAIEALVRAMSTDDAKLYLGAIIKDHGIDSMIDLNEEKIEEKPPTNNKMKKSELKEIIKAAMFEDARTDAEEEGYLDGMKDEKEDMKEAEDVEVEDNENIDVDIEKDVKIDDEESEVDIDVKASMPGESEDVEEVQALLMKAQQAATDLGDDKLTDQIGNTITYFTRAHVARVDEADLDMELDPTAVTKINPEAAAVIGLDEKGQGYNDKLDDAEGAKHGKKKQDMKQRRADSENMEKADGKRKFAGDSKMDKKNENLNESVAFPMWNKIK